MWRLSKREDDAGAVMLMRRNVHRAAARQPVSIYIETMTRWDLLPIVTVLATASLLAAHPAQQRGAITGVVRDAATGRPVAGAVISAYGQSGPPSTLSDAAGRFAFESIAPGSYSLNAHKGLARGLYGRRWVGGGFEPLAVLADQRRDIEILLWPAASVAGTVYDERNMPAPDVAVSAVRVDDGSPDRYVESSPQDRTDDRGTFVIDNLRPGRYAVCVLIRHRTTMAAFDNLELLARTLRDPGGELLVFSGEPAPPPSDTAGRPQAYLTTCAPSATTSNEFAEVSLQLGEQRSGIDIRMRTDRRFRVSGRIIQPRDPFDDIDLTLSPVDPMFARDFGPRSEAKGNRFLFMSVPPGEYILRARRSTGHSDVVTPDLRGLSFERRLTVRDDDVRDLVVEMRPGATISGRFVCEGETTATCWRGQPTIADERHFSPSGVADDGRFSMIVSTGTHRLQLEGFPKAPGWNLRSISLAGRDVTNAPFDVSEAGVADVIMSMTKQRTTVRGTVREGLTPRRDAVVVAFPHDIALWQGPHRVDELFQAVSPGSDGRYEILDLPAGSYLVAATTGLELNEWPGQATLQSLRRSATRVQVTFGQPVTVDLQMGSR